MSRGREPKRVQERASVGLSIQALQRMPAYLGYLRQCLDAGEKNVSAAKAAAFFGISEIQVRKDFAAVSAIPGKPKAGFSIVELIDGIEGYLGFRNTKEAVLVGAGSLGSALLRYGGFAPLGLTIVAAFDADPALVGQTVNGKPILPTEKLIDLCLRLNIRIGIVTVPAKHAQTVCDALVAGGVKAIWNFAPVALRVPEDVLVRSEDLAVSLAVLSHHLVQHDEKAGAEQGNG